MKEGLIFFVAPRAARRQGVQVDPFFETRIPHETIHPAAFTREKKVAQLRNSGGLWARRDICGQPVRERPSHHEFVRAPRTTIKLRGEGKNARITKGVGHLDGAFSADKAPISVRGVRLAGEFAKISQSTIRIGVACREATRQFLRETVRVNLFLLQPGRKSVRVASRHRSTSRAMEKAEIGPQAGSAPDLKGTNEKSRPTELLNLRVDVSHAQCVSHRSVETDRTDSGKHRLKSVHAFAAGINGKIGKTTLRTEEGVRPQFHETARHIQTRGNETGGGFLIEHQGVFGLEAVKATRFPGAPRSSSTSLAQHATIEESMPPLSKIEPSRAHRRSRVASLTRLKNCPGTSRKSEDKSGEEQCLPEPDGRQPPLLALGIEYYCAAGRNSSHGVQGRASGISAPLISECQKGGYRRVARALWHLGMARKSVDAACNEHSGATLRIEERPPARMRPGSKETSCSNVGHDEMRSRR